MTEADAIGPDGTVRLRCYLPQADTVWFSTGCEDLAGCGHAGPIGIRAAIRLMGLEATVRQPAGVHHAPAQHAPGLDTGERGAGAGDAGRAG